MYACVLTTENDQVGVTVYMPALLLVTMNNALAEIPKATTRARIAQASTIPKTSSNSQVGNPHLASRYLHLEQIFALHVLYF